jgi:putative transposase
VSCYKLIDAEKASYPVSELCGVLRVSRSGYYDWKGRPPSKRKRENADLTERIREIHQRGGETYGYPRVHAELRALGVDRNRKRVARLMRKDALQGCVRGRRRKHTTRQNLLAIPAPDLVERNFVATAPDRLWTADITYLPTDEGFLYLAFILDVYSRKVVGWSMASHLRSELVAAALKMAVHGGILPRDSFTTATGEANTQRSPLAKNWKQQESHRRWDGWDLRWTTQSRRALSLH